MRNKAYQSQMRSGFDYIGQLCNMHYMLAPSYLPRLDIAGARIVWWNRM